MQMLIFKISRGYEDISASVVIADTRDNSEKFLGTLDGLSLKDVEWLILANTSEHSTNFVTEIKE